MKNSCELWPEGETTEPIKTESLFSSMRLSINTAAYSNDAVLKPLLNGCLTGQIYALLSYSRLSFWVGVGKLLDHPELNKRLANVKLANIKNLKWNLLFGATYTTASLGVFEILTKKLGAKNEGRPLSLYQEACCGLVSSATAACIWRPLLVASWRTDPFTYKNLFSNIYRIVKSEGALTLWRGGAGLHVATLPGLYVSTQMAATVGMLASYKRSFNYLVDEKNLPKWQAQLNASIISGFFATVCSHPCIYVSAVRDVMKKQYQDGMKHVYRYIPFFISRILTPNSGLKFYVRFLNSFHQKAMVCMVQWWIFETIRTAEENISDHQLQ